MSSYNQYSNHKPLSNKIPVGILGATGMVGQKYIQLLDNHPYFQVTKLAASSNSAGQKFADLMQNRWQLDTPIPDQVGDIFVDDVSNIQDFSKDLKVLFSAFEMPQKEQIREIEEAYAKQGLMVFSNSAAHRWSEDVPMLIPEINPEHLEVLKSQRARLGTQTGGLVVKPNCSLQSYITAIFALNQAGFRVHKIMLTTLQALSGAGYPGVPSLDVIDNIVPYIGSEEDKTEKEPLKILGYLDSQQKFQNYKDLSISATCTRVPVIDGHTASVSIAFKDKVPSIEQVISIWQNFQSRPQELDLPLAPKRPIFYLSQENRPQPRKDRNLEKGMGLAIGRLRKCQILDYKFIGLSHNTVRGAAGGGILNAELAYQLGYIH